MPKPIRLLQIVDSLHAGGMENIMVQVCNHLDPARYAITICCLSREGPFKDRLNSSVTCVCLNKQSGFQWRTVRSLRCVMEDGFDLVHTHHLGGLIYAFLASPWWRRPKIVHSEHIILQPDDLQPKRLWQRRLLYRAASRVFTVSGEQLQQLRQVGLTHPHLFTLPNGVDCSRFCAVTEETQKQIRLQLGLEPEGVWFGKVARFAPAKRHLALIEAFELAAAERPEIRLLLVGDGGPEKEKVLARIASSPARNQIHWAGLQQDPVPWYQAMDVLVIASESEGMPNAALEGMACGLPLLSNAVCGIQEVATHGEHGWIESLDSVQAMQSALIRLADTAPATRIQRGAAARRHVQSRFSLAVMLERYDQLYSGTVAGQPPRFDIAPASLHSN